MSNERTAWDALGRRLLVSLVPVAIACGGGQHPAPVDNASPGPTEAITPSRTQSAPAPTAGVYVGTQQTTVRTNAPSPARGRVAASAQPVPVDAAGRIEVADEAGAVRFTIIEPSGGAPCVLAATGSPPGLAITADQTCTDARGTTTVTLHIQDGTAVFNSDSLTLDFHGAMEMQQAHGGRHTTRNGEVNYHFTGRRSSESAAPQPAASGPSTTPG